MTEDFLYFLWQYQQFDSTNLKTTMGEELQVVSVGFRNTNAGPDFSNARILIGGMAWAGNVEMHLKTSDWHAHNHDKDLAYQSVVLHVVWEADTNIHRPDGTLLPTLSLKNLADEGLLKNYQQLLQNSATILCANQLEGINKIYIFSMLDRALTHRLEHKAAFVHELLKRHQNDWEETAYQLLAYNFGFKINADPMLRLAQQLPLKVLQKHRNGLAQIEAVMLGQAGFLDKVEQIDGYVEAARREHHFFVSKYDLKNKKMNAHEWKFLRLRPANFPTVRIAQLAALIQKHESLFSLFINVEKVDDFQKLLKVEQSGYWQNHYVLAKSTESKVPNLGKSSIENVLINTVVPLLVAYSQHRSNRDYLDKAIQVLEQLPAEHNHITGEWENLGLKIKTAFDSQATIELYNNFCTNKKCLSCNIGTTLVRAKL